MRKTLMLAGFLLAAAPALADEKPVLTVYAPEYFAGEWGPGQKMAEGFEKTCGCDVKVVGVDVLPRILLEGDKTPADVVVGFTADVMQRAKDTGLFAPHREDLSRLTLPVAWTDDTFLPFDWSETAFVYDKTKVKNPPKSFADLLNAPDDAYKIAIEDPRTSLSGLALLLWVKSVYGDKAPEAWAKLAPKVLTVAPGWSEAYSLFTKGEADMVLSFTTSPAYHIIEEKDDTKAAAIFTEGNYFLAETAAQLKGTKHPELAQKFMDYLLSDDFQGMIGVGNWSYPAVMKPGFLPPEFEALPKAEKTLFLTPEAAEALRAPAIEEWRQAFRK
ncbi:thiamine ABC transporter substrate-binding protein [Paenirhodobacter enshiensis]|uniref:Thiamine ABC transporter substrate-binding protein n=1 Tax=Paenirhodobacter enshiensis TaxID=1105367 RepID=A0A086XU80_9RHOB|nr:thiamine ABC transporter substrate binding subunit [Paenirhodobacter enshiensis]KFI25580.1 thiamine ABC transporter substrate-binding protein [Paenirhodobacter enshiensis]